MRTPDANALEKTIKNNSQKGKPYTVQHFLAEGFK